MFRSCLLMAVGALSLAVGGWFLAQPPALPVSDVAAAATSDTPDAHRAPVDAGPAAPAHAIPRSPLAVEAPVHVSAPTMDVAAEVVPVGVDPAGALEVPEDPSILGWWSSGAVPGSARGTTVIAAHVDATARGTGPMLGLIDAPIGTRIDVRTSDGSHVTYEITERRSYAKDQGLPRDLFRTDGAPRIALITCGGTFDRTTQQYTDNVVILAN